MITIYKITHSEDCPKVILPISASDVFLNSDTEKRHKNWTGSPIAAKFDVRQKVSAEQFYFVDDSVLLLPESMLLQHEAIHWVTHGNAVSVSVSVNDINFEMIDILSHCPPDSGHHAPCFVSGHFAPLFRIKSDPLGIYASSGHLQPIDEFYGAYHLCKLRGLVFNPIWSGKT